MTATDRRNRPRRATHVLIGLLGTAAALLTTQATAAPSDATYTSTLMTRWGQAVTPANAWQSYPRPQMTRPRWQNLNGQWDYAITPRTAGEPEAMDGKILVPFAPESKLSGVARKVRPDQRLWYRRDFTVFSDWAGQRVMLHFGAVDFECQLWVNGGLVGGHKGGSSPFSFDITDFLKSGTNQISLAVTDPTSTGMQPRGKQTLDPGSIWYTAVSGIWQTVWLEPVPALHIEDVRATPDVDRGVLDVDVALNRSADDSDAVRITAIAQDRVVATTLVRANRHAELPIPDAHQWSPDDPFLYDLKVDLVKVADPFARRIAADARASRVLTSAERDAYVGARPMGPASDSVQSYFAMRKISVGPGAVAGQPVMLLNNKPLFQNGTLDQGWWPDGLLTAPSEAAMADDLSFLKRAGFNMLRKHIKVEPAQFYAMTDRMGLLVWQDMPSGEAGSDQFVAADSQSQAIMPMAATAEYQDELTRMIGDLRAFPSIILWVVNNEGWGQTDSATLAHLVKGLDPSRLVDADSGWLDVGDRASDVFDIHTYEEVPLVPARHALRAIAIGEYGGIGLPVEGHLWRPGKRNWGYQVATGPADYLARYRRKFAEVVRQAREFGLSAAVYTQTTDVEDEINGLESYDRAAQKIDAGTLAQIHAPLVQRPKR